MSQQMEGRVVIISGGARGQGAAEARWMVAEGAKVIIGDILDDAGDSLVAELTAVGGTAIYRHLDVREPNDWQETVDVVTATWGRLDALINNAGINDRSGILDVALSTWHNVLEVNLTGPLLGTKAVADAMAASGGGAIVNVSSVAGLTAYVNAAYTASKWGLRGLTKTAALELAPKRIRVNSVHPGLIETDMVVDAPSEFLRAFVSNTPAGRGGHSEEVASVVGFLCSEAASFVTGAEVTVDGGFSAAGQMQGVLSSMQRSLGTT